MRARGFLLGATAGRTTLAGEGLQHQDGHSQLVATTVPNCRAYDPAYAYELAVIIHDGLKRMYSDDESVYYYISVMNENYAQPALPPGSAEGIIKGAHQIRTGGKGKVRATLLGSGTILRESLAAAELLEQKFKIPSDVYSVTSFSELRREALDCERWNLLNPEQSPRVPYVQTLFAESAAPIIAATDYMRTVADQIRQWLPAGYVTLGTDGFGRGSQFYHARNPQGAGRCRADRSQDCDRGAPGIGHRPHQARSALQLEPPTRSRRWPPEKFRFPILATSRTSK
jgi:pyruvate dehydrogenase E1 component